jgi:hypothetical protein
MITSLTSKYPLTQNGLPRQEIARFAERFNIMIVTDFLNKLQEKTLWSYGWHTIDADDYLDREIQPGEYVRFYDDEMDTWNWGVYLGWYSDMSKSGDTSPYFCETYEGIDRLVIQDTVINPDGTISTRTNYALPENVYDWYEATNTAMNAELEAVS